MPTERHKTEIALFCEENSTAFELSKVIRVWFWNCAESRSNYDLIFRIDEKLENRVTKSFNFRDSLTLLSSTLN